MVMLKVENILLLLVFLCSVDTARAYFPIKDWKIWQLSISHDVKGNEQLYRALLKAEGFVENDDCGLAAEAIAEAKKMVKDDDTIADEPASLVLDSAELWYRSLFRGKKDIKNLKDAERLIKKFDKTAENKNYQSYKLLFHRIRDYYHCTGDYANKMAVQRRMIYYDPKDPEQWDSYLEYCRTYPSLNEDCESFVKGLLKEKGIAISPAMDLAILDSRFRKGDKTAFNCILLWLEKNRTTDKDTLKYAFSIIGQILDSRDNTMIKDYYFVLTNLALAQKTDSENAITLALILSEREKIKNVMQEIWNKEKK